MKPTGEERYRAAAERGLLWVVEVDEDGWLYHSTWPTRDDARLAAEARRRLMVDNVRIRRFHSYD